MLRLLVLALLIAATVWVARRAFAPPRQTPPLAPAPTRAEALAVLGLSEGASREQIIQAHRQLIQKLHPDRGGNAWLAAQINRAKDILLDERFSG